MSKHHVSTTINGEPVEFLCETQQTLLDVLRNELHLTGSKEGCASGDCGACSVILDGKVVCSCLMLGVEAEGIPSPRSRASPRATSCTRCSSVSWNMPPCNAVSARRASSSPPRRCWTRIPNPTETEIRYWLAGNLCRCTGYDKIVRAVQAAAADVRGEMVGEKVA